MDNIQESIKNDAIQKIASKYLGFDDLFSDAIDKVEFQPIHVNWAIKALKEAYEAGYQDGSNLEGNK